LKFESKCQRRAINRTWRSLLAAGDLAPEHWASNGFKLFIVSEASNYSVKHVRRGGLAGAENKNKFYDVF
jgi:hypothetical protein